MSSAETFSELAPLRAWFGSWCASFRTSDLDLQRNFDLKELHTRNVCQAALLITQDRGARSLMLAETAALCHDLGRFPQFRDFRTFKDSDSINHAHLSAQILCQHNLLDFLPKHERDAVVLAVRLHNAFEVPAGLDPETEELLRVLRDADKLDIWRVFIDYFHAPEHQRASGAGLGFPDLPFCSPEVLAAVSAQRMVQLCAMKTLNDFKMLQLSWIYDINFASTLRLIRERGVLDQLAATLPREQAVLDAVERVRGYLEQRLDRP